ncbi:hypothetical protein [Halosimplex marinum]|uniref:hypothetical protein n=1 Tax=Halosimplex marinum TaxID=3396620 RepID=UPI003F558243
MRSLGSALVCLLGVAAGCAAPGTQSSPAPTDAPGTASPVDTTSTASPAGTATPSATVAGTPTATPTRTPTPVAATPVPLRAAGRPCDEDLWIDFWRPQNDTGGWTASNVRVSYTLPANTSIFLVAYVDGRVAGVSFDADYGSDHYHVDGFGFDLDRAFTGPHLVQVAVYTDSNGNGRFDRGVDSPCLVDGEVLQAGPAHLNYSRYGTGS